MILILSDREDTTVRRVLPEIERRGVPVTWCGTGESAARSRVTATFGGEHLLPEVDPDGAPAPVEKRAGPLVRDAAAWAAA
ncbi:hypothetical protein [Microbispora bryophytorum]|uniref:Uncharacterized protein n=1 Tax=Microbispora bryophytorum TaxID=1460882 RepID=A0A8H9H5H4_9ACTN|nr:hypothetical protein [Microbispora bryophytorum]MBD3139728.1 hypothetical protein [Microbispora bryophytorum]TQS02715.1 hypothetical protein FLX07_27795 [Microbispora bryophytorum]GGO27621.1 hypothetical protein GCM10011574_61210 [Microbispora bryophytorum]